ncbi:MAG: type 4a pilus biogenesis protein PilO [Candidatus Omnitrophica bacterium]|nr:type 4a pilus biogenesis protein PilO [Candidatus Omnitrophota bacterium]
MILSSISKREKYIFSITIIVIVTAFLYNFIIEAGFKKWQILNNEIAVKRAKMNKGIRLIKRRDSIIQEYNEYAKSAKNISNILNDMEHQADMLGIKTSNIKPSQEIEKGLYKECVIELQIEGEMANIIKFVSQIAKPPILAILKKFDFSLVSQNPSVFKGTIILSKLII